MSGDIEFGNTDNTNELLSKNPEIQDLKQTIYEMMLEFMDSIAAQNQKKAEDVVDRLLVITEGDIYQEVGKITRKLHDSIKEIKSDFSKLTDKDVPEAVDMLESVNHKTEEAVNRTMAIVEKKFSEMEEFDSHMKNIQGPDESINYLSSFRESLSNDMTEILTIQQFQDLTGQTIKKVIGLVHDVEVELLRLVTSFGLNIESGKNDEAETKEKVTQNDVDDLLKGLGF